MTSKQKERIKIRQQLGIQNDRGATWTGVRPVVFTDKRRRSLQKIARKEISCFV